MAETEKKLVDKYNIHDVTEYACRLNEACPVAKVNPDFSPEKIAKVARKNPKDLLKSPMIWECLACGLCGVVTGGRVNMSYFVRDMRQKAANAGFGGTATHGGMLITAQRMNDIKSLKPDRTKWISDPLKATFKKGKYLYWVGGAPFFDAVMPELNTGALDSARAAILLLNRLGIEPVVLKEERFSGHDLLWTGDKKGFRSLAEKNLMAIKKSGAEMVIVSSPEDYYTIAKSYREYFGELDFEVCHITEFAAKNLSKLKFREYRERAAYHDPCRLGRGMGVYDAPRQILGAIPGMELVKMKGEREFSSCCGTSCWMNCNRYSKLMQVNRLKESVDAGARVFITTCQECIIHFRCATRSEAWRQVSIDVKDLIVLAVSLLEDRKRISRSKRKKRG